MAKILSKTDSDKIKKLHSQIPETDWMCEGYGDNELVFFNNTEEKTLYVNYCKGTIVNPDNVIITPVLKKFINIEMEIARICYL